MAEMIDRQAAMDAFAERVKRSNNSDFVPAPTWNNAVEIVENLPSVDAVGVVRCKDCKHHSDEEPGMVYCPEIIGGWVKNDCFCAIWEGKKDG